jgi:15-cis-phytoene synthase
MISPQPPSHAAITQHGSQKMKVGSLTFSFAASLLGSKAKSGIFWLYAWCRECDDIVDDPEAATRPELLMQRVKMIRELTLSDSDDPSPAFVGMRRLLTTYDIPKYYAQELINGMEMDISKKRYKDMDELLSYCYRVAGTVGLMSCSIFGLKSISALKNAESFGMAMQITNIARDVFEDFRMGRIYLPLAYLRDEGIIEEELLNITQRDRLVRVVSRLLTDADQLYRVGFVGTIHLPWRCALAVYTAGLIYRDIGRIILKRGARAWDRRAVVSASRKFFLASVAFLTILSQLPRRILFPKKKIPIEKIRLNSWSPS